MSGKGSLSWAEKQRCVENCFGSLRVFEVARSQRLLGVESLESARNVVEDPEAAWSMYCGVQPKDTILCALQSLLGMHRMLVVEGRISVVSRSDKFGMQMPRHLRHLTNAPEARLEGLLDLYLILYRSP